MVSCSLAKSPQLHQHALHLHPAEDAIDQAGVWLQGGGHAQHARGGGAGPQVCDGRADGWRLGKGGEKKHLDERLNVLLLNV